MLHTIGILGKSETQRLSCIDFELLKFFTGASLRIQNFSIITQNITKLRAKFWFSNAERIKCLYLKKKNSKSKEAQAIGIIKLPLLKMSTTYDIYLI